MKEFETARLRPRAWRDEDLDAYARMCADSEVMRYISGGVPRTREQAESSIARFRREWEERGFGMWAAEEKATGRFVGRVGLLYHEDWTEGDDKVEIGWRIDRAHWGRGLATEGALASLCYGFKEIGLQRIISIAMAQNVASRRVMEKAGLAYRGEARWRGLDVIWAAIDRQDWGSSKPTG